MHLTSAFTFKVTSGCAENKAILVFHLFHMLVSVDTMMSIYCRLHKLMKQMIQAPAPKPNVAFILSPGYTFFIFSMDKRSIRGQQIK